MKIKNNFSSTLLYLFYSLLCIISATGTMFMLRKGPAWLLALIWISSAIVLAFVYSKLIVTAHKKYDANTEYFLNNKVSVPQQTNSSPPVNMQILKTIEWLAANNKEVCWPDGAYKKFNELSEEIQHVIDGMLYISPYSYDCAVAVLNLPEGIKNDT